MQEKKRCNGSQRIHSATVPISSPDTAILLVCARDRVLSPPKTRPRLACSFHPQCLAHALNRTGTTISWFRFWIRPELLGVHRSGDPSELPDNKRATMGMLISASNGSVSKQLCKLKYYPISMFGKNFCSIVCLFLKSNFGNLH